jgi:hypothetical protein
MDPQELWKYVLVIVVGIALVLHAVFPRYEWRSVGSDGMSIVVYDRWAGSFQHVVWDEKGSAKPTEPFKP